MRYVALSDVHLGKHQFSAMENGRNAREQDVERAWARAVQIAVDAKPDLVTIAGDVFEHPRISSHAIKAYRDGVRRIVQETEAAVVILQGNHEAARTAESLTPLVIPDDYERVHVVLEPKRIRLHPPHWTGEAHETVSVACLPFVVRGEEATYRLEPDPYADVNLLLIHAPVNTSAEGVERLPVFYAGRTALDVGRLAEQFDVIAAGDFHNFTRLHPTRAAFYSGSLERVSSNIWNETGPKGLVVGDTATGEVEFVEVPTRAMYDWELLDWDLDPIEPSAEDVNQCLASLASDNETAGAIVRLRVDDFPREEKDAIDWAAVRQLKQTALHFQLDLRYADAAPGDFGDRRTHAVRPLMDQARDFFADDPADVRDTALAYLGGD